MRETSLSHTFKTKSCMGRLDFGDDRNQDKSNKRMVVVVDGTEYPYYPVSDHHSTDTGRTPVPLVATGLSKHFGEETLTYIPRRPISSFT